MFNHSLFFWKSFSLGLVGGGVTWYKLMVFKNICQPLLTVWVQPLYRVAENSEFEWKYEKYSEREWSQKTKRNSKLSFIFLLISSYFVHIFPSPCKDFPGRQPPLSPLSPTLVSLRPPRVPTCIITADKSRELCGLELGGSSQPPDYQRHLQLCLGLLQPPGGPIEIKLDKTMDSSGMNSILSKYGILIKDKVKIILIKPPTVKERSAVYWGHNTSVCFYSFIYHFQFEVSIENLKI